MLPGAWGRIPERPGLGKCRGGRQQRAGTGCSQAIRSVNAVRMVQAPSPDAFSPRCLHPTLPAHPLPLAVVAPAHSITPPAPPKRGNLG